MTRRTTLVCLLACALLLPQLLRAEHTHYWKQTDYSEFLKGTATGVAIRSDGRLMPAPKFHPFADPNLPYLWALRLDSHGTLFAAGGSDAKVLRIDDSGKSTAVFDSSELAAQAIAFDAKDNLYVGTSPDGKVYKVTPAGQKSVFFDPKTKYIWALAVDGQGDVFVATGDKGEVFVVTPDAKGQLFFQSQERHARSLTFDPKGNLLIGTEPDGLILRVGIERKNPGAVPQAGAPFVIYETDRAEVTSLLEDSSGNLYASSIGDKVHPQGGSRGTPGEGEPAAGPPSQGPSGAAGPSNPAPEDAPAPFPVAASGTSQVVKIAPDGSPETLWTSHGELVFSMDLSTAGKVLLGTGDMGTIIELEGNAVFSSIAKTESAQVTSLVTGPNGQIFAATANPGKIFTLGPGYESGGSFVSDTFDAKIFSHWGRLTWWGENGAMQGKVELYARSGNTSDPTNNWSAWAGPYKTSDSEPMNCPPARFAQWKAVFTDTNGSSVPDISWVSLAYQPKNVAPVVDDIVVQNPGVRAMGFGGSNGIPGTSASAALRNPHSAGGMSSSSPVSTEGSSRASRNDIPPQGFEAKGYESVLWSAHDDNDDDLVYGVYYRAENEQSWHLLKDKLTQRYFSWDTATMPDGAYFLKIVASDSPSNPNDQALSAERASDRFQIANTPPRIDNLRADSGTPAVNISFSAISSSGVIDNAQYSLDAGDWQTVFPTGLLSDAPKESYQIQIPGLSNGEHTLSVQIEDGFGNTASARVAFTVPARTTR